MLYEVITPVEVERPRDRSHGDWATNAALVGARSAGMAPRDLAAVLMRNLPEVPYLEKVDVAGPGFINFENYSAVNGTGIALLTRLLSEARAAGTKVCITGLSENFKTIFDMVGITRVITSYSIHYTKLYESG